MRKMKDSGIEWIGEIPEEWEVKNLKFLGNTKSGLGNKKPQDFGHGYPFISYKNIYNNYAIDETYDDLVNSTDIDRQNYSVTRGDVFFTGSSETIEELGMASMCLRDIPNATFNGFSIRFRPYSLINYYPEFMMYYFRSEATREHLIRNDNSITRANLSQKLLNKLPVINPPLEEQQKIANYLDDKVAHIDNIIEKTKSTIEEYKEYRQSLITETVTKGLNPDVKMKDSGIEWFGEIPEHWEVKKSKYIFEIIKRIAGETGYDVLSVTQQGLKVKNITSNEGQMSSDYSKYQFVYEGDFVMNHMDLLTGWVDLSVFNGVTSPDYRVFRMKEEIEYSKEYYKSIFQVCYTNKIFYGLGQGVSNLGRWRLPTVNFINFYLTVPPKEEQEQIVNFLNEKTNVVNQLIDKKVLLINKLESYKKSLIYEVVTGKKEIN